MHSNHHIPFNKLFVTGNGLKYLAQAQSNQHLSGDGIFTKLCQDWLMQNTGSYKALLTHSCTAALEMAALLLDLKPGDEVIMPSYTFVSTANAFVLRGATPVFVDIRKDTLNIDEKLIESAITDRTKAIVAVHYAGVACEMDVIMEIAERHKLKVVEDAAQGILAKYKNRALGSIGHLGALSFHETKNIISGEGGCLLINDPKLSLRAEIIREKGTDRSRFFRGEVDKYTWQDVGSSYLPSELISAFLYSQLESAEEIIEERLKAWHYYDYLLKKANTYDRIKTPAIPSECLQNGHIYYVLLQNNINREAVIGSLNRDQINAVFHYVPLHSSPAGLKYGRAMGEMMNTVNLSEQLIRLPLWRGITKDEQTRVVKSLLLAL